MDFIALSGLWVGAGLITIGFSLAKRLIRPH